LGIRGAGGRLVSTGSGEPAAAGFAIGDEDGVTATEDEIFSAVTTALGPYRKEGASITAETDISQDLTLDSVAMLDLLMELEEKFDVSIPLNLVPEIRTVGQLAETVRKLKEG
jgi:acyl carrier protein